MRAWGEEKCGGACDEERDTQEEERRVPRFADSARDDRLEVVT